VGQGRVGTAHGQHCRGAGRAGGAG
jgi:hypothetical protein